MVDIQSISAGLRLDEDGIWYAQDNQDISYPSGGNEGAFAVEDGSFWFRHRNNCIISIVKNYPPEGNGTIFDIGGGNGFVASGLVDAGFDVALLEPGKTGALNAKMRGLKNVICATTDTANLKQNSLSAVGLFDVVEHMQDDLSFVQSIRNILKENGRLYVTVPSYSFLWSEKDINAGHFRRYTLKGISNLLEFAGFKVEFASYIFRFLPIPIYLLRTLPYKLGLSKAEVSVESGSRDHAEKGGVIADTLSSILRLEINNLDNRKAMRFGGSCLLVTRPSQNL
jgi:SAM-dependent methyltransferase